MRNPKEIILRTIEKMEGGFQDDPNDSGNWTGGVVGQGELKGTKYGISAASYPDEDIRNLTVDRALELYMNDYFNRLHLGRLSSDRIRWKLFDVAVNFGKARPLQIVAQAMKDMGYQVATDDPLEWMDRLNDAVAFWKSDEVPIRELAEWQMRRYVAIVTASPAKLAYLSIWTKRAFDTAEEYR